MAHRVADMTHGSRGRCFGPLVLAVFAALALSAPASAATGGTIATVAGNGTGGFSGDGGAAISASINGPRGVAWMPDGGFVFVDFLNERVRRVLPDRTIVTVAGNGEPCANPAAPCGDGGLATSAQFKFVHGVAVLSNGSLVIADSLDHRIRLVDAATGVITTLAGTGVPGYSGDGGPAAAASINNPRAIATQGNDVYFPDTDNRVVRKISAATGIISTVAGGGSQPPPVAGSPAVNATAAQLGTAFSVGPTSDGGLLIADATENEVDRVSPDGTITRVAGRGVAGDLVSAGDGGPATAAVLSKPHSVAEMPGGGYVIAEVAPGALPNNRVRHVATDGTISTVVNSSGMAGSTGDGGPAGNARIFGPKGLAVRSDGLVLIAEFGPNDFAAPGGDRIRAFTVVNQPAPPRRVLASVRAAFAAGRTGTRVRSLAVAGIPAPATVELRCAKGCPFKRVRRTNATANARLSLGSAFKGRRLPAGTVVEVRITQAGAVGRLVRFTMRRGRSPRRVALCLSTSNRTQRC